MTVWLLSHNPIPIILEYKLRMESGPSEDEASTSTWKPSVIFTRGDIEDSVFVDAGMGTSHDADHLQIQQEMQTHQSNHRPTQHHRQAMHPHRNVRAHHSFNFCIYGLTLFIPGIAMLIVYFFLSRRGGESGWQPSDAFVITGAILIGFSVVAVLVGSWQYCQAQLHPEEHQRRRDDHTANEPPSYDKFKKISKPSASTDLRDEELPPSFESCFAEKDKYLAGISNVGFENDSNSDESNPNEDTPPVYSIVNEQQTMHQESATDSCDRPASAGPSQATE